MNSTLLLIICDFLLLSLLALARFDTPEEDQPEMEVLPEDPIQAQEDIIEVLKLSLELEEESNVNMAASLQETQQELESTSENLEQTQEELATTEAERRELEDNLEERIAVLNTTQKEVEQMNQTLEEQRREAERQLRQMEALQRELQQSQSDIAAAAERQAELEAANRASEQRAATLDTQLQLAETESRLVRENLQQVRAEVLTVREENQRLQEHASQLATNLTEGVNAQTARLTQIAEEVRRAQPRNANQIFSDFLGSGVSIDLRFQKSNRRGGNEELVNVLPVVVSDGTDLKAIFSWEDLGISENDLRNANINVRGNIRLGRRTYPLTTVDFLSIDNRILAVPFDPGWAEFLESEPFYVATDPLQFPQAVLVDRKNNGYGDAPFKLEPKTPKHFRFDSRFMNRLMGEFKPRESSVMFSKSGDFLGVMVNREYAAHIDNFVASETVTLGREDTYKQFQSGYTKMVNQTRRFPSNVR